MGRMAVLTLPCARDDKIALIHSSEGRFFEFICFKPAWPKPS
ncbi:Uncharacterized protein ChrSV_0611 [Chromobacterium vaccinii]|nr:Uncharacterized protein ChrSW_0611 [Chromobacterium vaccinii]QND88070.1 Uncharacterized protein ChrSV_0611 [Chromobacterium vaccinii]